LGPRPRRHDLNRGEQPLTAPRRPVPRRKERWKRRKPAIGMRQAMNIAARKTPSEVCDSIEGKRTESGCLFGFVRTSRGHRKSFHDASRANIETTPRIGFDIGSTILQKSWKGPAPSISAASKISRGRLSKKRVTRITLNALAPAGSHTAQYVSMNVWCTIGGRTISI